MEESQQWFIIFAKGIGGFNAHLLLNDFPILIVDSEQQAPGIISALKDTGYSDLEFSSQPFTAEAQYKIAGHEVLIDKALGGERGVDARKLCKTAKEIFQRSGGRQNRDTITCDVDTETGNGGSTTTAEAGDGNRFDVLAKLEPATRKAYMSFTYAEAKAERRLQDRDAYDLLEEQGIDVESGELTDYELPEFSNWSRYLRKARNATGEQKYTPRTR